MLLQDLGMLSYSEEKFEEHFVSTGWFEIMSTISLYYIENLFYCIDFILPSASKFLQLDLFRGERTSKRIIVRTSRKFRLDE